MNRKSIKNIEDFDVYQKTVKLFKSFIEEDLPGAVFLAALY